MSLAVGIDLGTTYSCVARFYRDKPEAIVNREGARTTPSVVYYNDDLQPITGTSASKNAKLPQNVITDVKSLIGRKFTSINSLKEQVKRNYNMSLNNNHEALITVQNRQGKVLYKTPQEISAVVLKTLAEAAKDRMGSAFENEVVITVPAYFNNDQRAATIEAGKLAGLKVLKLLNEPTAAALAFAYNHVKTGAKKLIAVYDFGGGTFDISIIELNGRNVTVKAIAGDCNLGGRNINELLMSKLKKFISIKYNVDVDNVEPNKRYRILYRMEKTCEELKKELSLQNNGVLILEALGLKGLEDDIEFNLKRDEFEDEIRPIVTKTMHIVEDCFKEAKLKCTDIDDVLLVGGSSRIPLVQHYLTRKFGEAKISRKENPDEVVAEGASIQAAMLSSNPSKAINDICLIDILAMSLGTATKGDKMSILIRRNTRLPAEHSKVYKTMEDYQNRMTIEVFEGEDPVASKNTLLKAMVVDGITSAKAGEVLVTVKFSVDENGILSVTASEKNNKGNIHELRVSLNRGAQSS